MVQTDGCHGEVGREASGQTNSQQERIQNLFLGGGGGGGGGGHKIYILIDMALVFN